MSSSSGSQADEIKPVYHSNHSYLFSEITKRHPDLTSDELEKEFKTNLEGAYIVNLLDMEGAFYHISPSQVNAFKAFAADEAMWRRYRKYSLKSCTELEVKKKPSTTFE